MGAEMKFLIPGGSGQLGAILSRSLLEAGHQIVVLTRSSPRTAHSSGLRFVQWDAKSQGPWTKQLEKSDVIINLAGRSVNCRYNAANRQLILNSRVDSTRAIGQALNNCESPPAVWLQSSTATIYAHQFDQANDEGGLLGGNEPGLPKTWKFSIDVAKAWEDAAMEFAGLPTRQVLLRTAMVMSPDPEGVFDVLMGLCNKGLAGRNGDGRQFVSWIHERDFVAAIAWLIDQQELSGAVNLASPNPLPNDSFMRILREVAGQPIGLPANRWMLELGAVFLRTETELVLKSRRVIPGRLSASGFEFQFPDWKSAAAELFLRWQKSRSQQ